MGGGASSVVHVGGREYTPSIACSAYPGRQGCKCAHALTLLVTTTATTSPPGLTHQCILLPLLPLGLPQKLLQCLRCCIRVGPGYAVDTRSAGGGRERCVFFRAPPYRPTLLPCDAGQHVFIQAGRQGAC